MTDETPPGSKKAGQESGYDKLAVARRKIERFDQVMRDLPPHQADETPPETSKTVQVNGYEVPADQLGWIMDEYMRLKAADNWDYDPVRMGESIDNEGNQESTSE